MIEIELPSPQATMALGGVVAGALRTGDVVLLIGELGAGKTTLVRGLVEGLGGRDVVTSPTFTLRHEYATDPPLTHVDCWRIEQEGELVDLALDDVLADGGALVIEWGELARALFPDALEISLTDAADGAARCARIVGASWTDRLDLLAEAVRGGGLAESDLDGADRDGLEQAR